MSVICDQVAKVILISIEQLIILKKFNTFI